MSPRTKNIYRRSVRLALLALTLTLLGIFAYAQIADEDNDGIPDSFESLFGLNRNADDSAGDPDQDGLSNLDESLLGTDPFNADTDFDGWDDAVDADPVSRAVFPWGEPRFTFDSEVLYTWPLWAIGAQAEGGQWIDEVPWGWIPDDDESRLLMYLDRTQFSNDLWMAVAAPGAVAGDYLVSLCDTNLTALAAPIALVPAEAPWLTNRLPLAAYSSAAVVSLFSTQGLAPVTISMLYADADGDGLDDLQAAQLAAAAGATNTPAIVTVSGVVSYNGTQPGYIHVVAVTNANSLTSPWHTTLVNPGAYSLVAIPVPATYWIRAYVDANDNGSNDCWEARGDGLPAPLYLVCATNVHVTLNDPDSNNDGLSDWGAMQVGLDPALSNACARFPFVELFETNTVRLGDIHGQNGWVASVTNTAFVQSDRVYAGQQALMIDAPSSNATVYQVFAADAARIVWTDLRMIAELGCPGATNTTDAACGFFLDDSGRLVVLDGLQPAGRKWVTLTNHPPVSAGEWVRISICLDFAGQRWLIGLNGDKVAENLGFGIPCDQLHMLSWQGKRGVMDNLTISTNMPPDLSLDGDDLPDVWELQWFGNLDETADDDPDHDGLTNQEERQRGTDPTRADSDGDGLPDGWELVHGFNPSDPSDSSADPDGDGLTNLQEYQLDSDPHVADTDGDGMADGWEIAAGFDPLRADAGAVPDRGMVLWLRADDLAAGTAVALWPDRSGWSHDMTQTVSSCRPVVLSNAVNGRPAVAFDGSNDTLAGRVGGITGAVSVVTVCRFDSLSQVAGDYDYVLNMGEDQTLKHLSVSRCAAGYASGWDNAYYSYMGGSAGSVRGPALPGQYWLAIIAVHATNGTAHTVCVNGVAEAAQQYAGTLTLDGSVDLGRFVKPGYANHYLRGRIAEVFVYDRALGTNECQTLYAYLQDRYALKREGRPEVHAGADRQLLEGQTANLDGTVSDDGEPNPPGQVTCQWTKTAGPGEVSFADATAPQTTAGFSQSGAYMLRLTASDGFLTAFDEVQVTVSVPASANVPTTGLRLWLKADGLPLADGAPVAAWRDASGQGHDLSQAAVAAQPVFRTNALAGRPAVEFDGANDALAGQVGGITGAVSVVAVCRFEALDQAVGDYDYVLRLGEDQTLKHLSVSRCAAGYASGWDNAYYSYMGGALVSVRGPALPGRQWMTIAAVHSPSGTTHTVYLNGAPVWAQQYTGTLTLDGSIDLGRFVKPGYANHYLRGRIAEALVYDRALQAQDMLDIHDYLQTKYGVPEVSDVDADGLSDALEARLGTDPLASSACARLPFLERFEPDTCAVGDLHGQHGWEAWPSYAAIVQTNAVYEGAQALALCATNDGPAVARQLFAGTASRTIWADIRLMAQETAVPTGNVDAAAAFLVDANGRLVVLDGRLNGTNRWVALTDHPAIAMGRWIRLSASLDYASQTWSICLDGIKLAEGLGFGAPCDQLRDLRLIGARGNADHISIGFDVPAGLSLDGDGLPDDWEIRYFGDTGQDAAGDTDGDGVSNLDEYLAGTDPTVSDTDGDGLPDGWELAHGLNPLLASDASADGDDDGLSTLQEYVLGTDVNVADSDGDGLSDGAEVNDWHTDPLAVDSDGDGYADGDEVERGTDPVDPESHPASQWRRQLQLTFRDGIVTNRLTDVPVLVRLTPERVDYAQFAVAGADLRFTDSVGEPLDYEIEAWNPAGDSFVWVRLPEVGATNAPVSFFMKWGYPAATNAANSAGVWQSYAGVWHLSETNDVFADSAPGQYDAYNIGAVAVAGILGNARNFRGSDRIIVPPEAFASISNAVTISFWQYGATNQPRNDTCFEGTGPAGRELNAHIPWGDGNVYWDAFGNYDRLYRAAATNEYKGGWNRWTFTKDRVAGTMAIYLNGELWAKATGKTRAYTPVTSFGLGSAANGASGYRGRMDEVRVAPVAQSPAWIRFQYQTMLDQMLIYGEQQVSIAGTAHAAEPGQSGEFTVSRTAQNTNLPLTVTLAVPGGTAAEGADFALLPRMVVIPAGSLQATLAVPVLDDLWLEGAETVTVSLAQGNYFIDPAQAAAAIVIADDDQDTDADGLCDAWEIQRFGNLDAAADDDADGDGVNNRDEYLHGTDPHTADTDGDGLPDAWEIAWGTHPLVADASADPDHDELTNMQEYQDGSNPLSADGDGDGLPDPWELAHGLNPADASDAALDPDNDGLTNLGEYRAGADRLNPDTDGDGLTDGDEVNVWHTNPLSADTDGDGMPDAWEVACGLNPLYPFDADQDTDHDGLNNIEEYRAGTNPLSADTDGDGVSDYVETRQAYSDPVVADFLGIPVVLATLQGGSAFRFSGAWEALDSAFVCLGRGGYAEYEITLPNAGDFSLAVDVRDYNPLAVGATFDLTIHADGVFAGRQIVPAAAGQTATGAFFLPYMEAGSHTVRVTWNNPVGGHALAIMALRLQTFNGPDEDDNGRADWLDHRRSRALSAYSPAVSLVSPVCVEGATWSFDTLRVESSHVPDGVAAPAPKHGVGNDWYADVELSPTNATDVSVTGINGAASWSNTIVWCALNLLDPAATNVPGLRRNDALLLTACPPGATNGGAQVGVWMGGQLVTNLSACVGEPAPYRFESAGSYRLAGVYSNENVSTNADIAIEVTAGSFGGDPYCRVKQVRDWLCPGMPTNAVIEYDADLTLGSSPLAGGGRAFSLRTDTVDDRHVVARLGGNGPVLDSATVRGIVMDSSAYGTVDIIETYPDGSRLVEVAIWMSATPANLRMRLNIFVGGVLFDDGTRTRIVTAEDFNEFGEYRYRMVQGPTVKTSVCHTTSIYDGATYIGGP